MVTKTIIILLSVCVLGHDYLIQGAQAAAGAAAASAANQASQASSVSTTTTTAINEASSGAASAAGAGAGAGGWPAGAGAAAIAGGGPLSQVQGLVGGALSIASMPLNTITTSLNQLGLQNLAQAPFNAMSSLIHQAGGSYGRR